MKKILLVILIAVLLVFSVEAMAPAKPACIEDLETECHTCTITAEAAPQNDTAGCYTDAEINMITNVVNGEVGGICGTVVLTYADGSQLWTGGCMLHRIHARVVDNQVKSELFPSSVSGCVKQYWSTAYAGTDWRSSAQWQHCREDVVDAFDGDIYVPDNVFAATCDPCFPTWYPGYSLYARVDWDTGWCSGSFYYYAYNG